MLYEVITSRPHPDLQSVVGMFVNTVPLRSEPKNDLTFTHFLSNVKSNTLQAFDNQDYPYEELINDLNLERDSSRNPLFDILFVFLKVEDSDTKIPDCEFETYNIEQNISKFDLTLSAFEMFDNVIFEFEYCSSLFKRDTINRFIDYFKRIVKALCVNPNVKLSDIEIVSPEEKQFILEEYNDTSVV